MGPNITSLNPKLALRQVALAKCLFSPFTELNAMRCESHKTAMPAILVESSVCMNQGRCHIAQDTSGSTPSVVTRVTGAHTCEYACQQYAEPFQNSFPGGLVGRALNGASHFGTLWNLSNMATNHFHAAGHHRHRTLLLPGASCRTPSNASPSDALLTAAIRQHGTECQ